MPVSAFQSNSGRSGVRFLAQEGILQEHLEPPLVPWKEPSRLIGAGREWTVGLSGPGGRGRLVSVLGEGGHPDQTASYTPAPLRTSPADTRSSGWSGTSPSSGSLRTPILGGAPVPKARVASDRLRLSLQLPAHGLGQGASQSPELGKALTAPGRRREPRRKQRPGDGEGPGRPRGTLALFLNVRQLLLKTYENEKTRRIQGLLTAGGTSSVHVLPHS